MTIQFLEAYNGDAIHITFNDIDGRRRNMLIDGGVGKTYSAKVKKKTEYNGLYTTIQSIRQKNERIDLLVMTHVDDDHIAGILQWFKHDKAALDLIDKIWFNSGRLIKEYFHKTENLEENDLTVAPGDDTLQTSIPQGVALEQMIKAPAGVWEQKVISRGYEAFVGEAKLTVLSPDRPGLQKLVKKWEVEAPDSLYTSKKTDFHHLLTELINGEDTYQEDTAVHNGSSIAFLLTKDTYNFLFLADAHPSVIVNALMDLGYSAKKKLYCKIVKLSHHGSVYNNSPELLDLIESDHYVISTNSDIHGHPHKQLIARLIRLKGEPSIHFNYPFLAEEIFAVDNLDDYLFLKNISKQNNAFNF